jgi:hypothetical protein
LAGRRRLFSPGINTGPHPFPICLHLGYYLFSNDIYPSLVDIHPGDESTSKNLKLLIIGSYFSFDLCFQPCHQLFFNFLKFTSVLAPILASISWLVFISSWLEFIRSRGLDIRYDG